MLVSEKGNAEVYSLSLWKLRRREIVETMLALPLSDILLPVTLCSLEYSPQWPGAVALALLQLPAAVAVCPLLSGPLAG